MITRDLNLVLLLKNLKTNKVNTAIYIRKFQYVRYENYEFTRDDHNYYTAENKHKEKKRRKKKVDL